MRERRLKEAKRSPPSIAVAVSLALVHARQPAVREAGLNAAKRRAVAAALEEHAFILDPHFGPALQKIGALVD